MRFRNRFASIPLELTLALGLALSLVAGVASAATPKGAAAAPTALSSTLDVCADEASGAWRYSGVVAVQGADGAVRVDNRIQNQQSRAGYADALAAKSAVQAGVQRAGGTVVVPYALTAAPLSLGLLRGSATVEVLGQSRDPNLRTLTVQTEALTADAVCGCAPKGCVRTQGYWSNKPGVVWPAPYDRNAPFFSSGLAWQQILDSPVRGNAYLILAHQYIAAVLNRAAGASAPGGVQNTINAATAWFQSGVTLSTCGPGECGLQKTWAGTLDVYNNGQYPGAPKHCPD